VAKRHLSYEYCIKSNIISDKKLYKAPKSIVLHIAITLGNNPMVGCSVACAVAIEQAK